MKPHKPLIAAAAATLLLAGCSSGGNYTDPTDKLEVLSWWSSASERPAFEVLTGAFEKANPGVRLINAAVEGGGGSNAQVALAERLAANNPPDLWQSLTGSAVDGWASARRIVDIEPVFARTGIGPALAPAIRDSVMRDGKPWAMPTGAHRGNNLWFNRDALAKAGVEVPGAGYTQDRLAGDLDKVAAAGITPLCLGSADRFALVELFENTLLGIVGPGGWQRIADDRFDWGGSEVSTALDRFGAYVGHAGRDADTTHWADAVAKLSRGECAFLSMNDSAYGELTATGAVDGQQFGYAPFPGTEGAYLAIVDTFVAAKKAKNGVNALKFLDTVADPATMLAFTRAKGSVPVRRDVDTSTLSPYQRGASAALWHDRVLLSITHGELMSTAFQQALYDAVGDFAKHRDKRAFINTVQRAGTTGQIGGR
ncbi:ABC transporter substrate-binding protein [Gordonia sp. (in: high G+C Gram-positive bacteria)]|uniref:ABC transporter substrate-binding protein n=1 Tax=Gordonia sp. (in: high G+C Gram-positive bacteria) TaxID=84139 RepID=UPI0039E4AD67